MVFGAHRAAKEGIFVNYRRDDAGGYAGRLSDTLSGYFGAERIFRDVTGIEYGHDFEAVIDEKLSESGILIVLIGESWAGASDCEGRRRLDDPQDYVTREISLALQAGMPILPVLIGDARMPQVDELPESIRALARYNALTVTDERWNHDVDRLAKVIAIDVPGSVAQRRLDRLKTASLALLSLGGILSASVFCMAVVGWVEGGDGIRDYGYTPLVASIPFMAIFFAGVFTLLGLRDIEPRNRKFGWGAVYLAGIGGIGSFVHYLLTNNQTPSWSLVVSFCASTIIIIGLLALIAMAGFRAK